MTATTKEVRELTVSIGELLNGKNHEVVATTLANIVALWLAGYQGEGAEHMRDTALTQFVMLVERLIPINEKMIKEALARKN
jgi:hypothetical protein